MRSCTLALLGSALVAAPAPAADASYAGTLDPSFGVRGRVAVAAPSGAAATADALALQPDGSIIVVGHTDTAVMVARLTASGKPDTGFGGAGTVTLGDVAPMAATPATPAPARAAVALLADGSMLVLGSSLAHLQSDGTRDMGFGSGGLADLPAGFSPAAMAPAAGGDVLVAGSVPTGGRSAGAVAELTAGGHAEQSFGTGGLSTLPPVATFEGDAIDPLALRGVAATSQGPIYVAGVGGTPPSGPSFGGVAVVGRLTAGGQLDGAFGSNGQIVLEGHGPEPRTLRARPDGSAVAAGLMCAHISVTPYVEAFDAGSTSRAPSSQICMPGGAAALAPLPDGGWLWLGSELVRFDSTLRADPRLGTDDAGTDDPSILGAARLSLGPDVQGLSDAAVLPGGRVVIAGGTTRDMLVARVFGLSPPPPPRVSIPDQQLTATALGVGARLRCGPYVTCIGDGLLRSGRVVLARGTFAIAAEHTSELVMALTDAGLTRLRSHRPIGATLTVTGSGARPLTRRLTVAPMTPVAPSGRSRLGPLRPFASAATSFDSDGRRYVVFRQDTRVEVLDTRTQRRYTATMPAGCTAKPSRSDLSFPMVLLHCYQPTLLNVATGRSFTVDGVTGAARIGRYWMGPFSADTCQSYTADHCRRYLNWRTRAVRDIRIAGPALAHTPARDLDSRTLAAVRPCRPFVTTTSPNGPVDVPAGTYEPPYVLFGNGLGFTSPTSAVGLNLGRCGDPHGVQLDGSTQFASAPAVQPQLGSRHVSWSLPGSTAAYLYDIAHRRKRTWNAPGGSLAFSMPVAIVHTADAVIVGSASHEVCFGRSPKNTCTTDVWTLYQARIR